MKSILSPLVLIFATIHSFAQISGNVNYQNQVRYPDQNIDVLLPGNSNVVLTIKGLANLTADTYVAIFSVTQVGKTTDEVNSLIDNRISQALTNLKAKPGIETFVDMISFVPMYEFEVEKKIFSKKTYNEVPKGFELKKNIHIKYKDPNLLNQIITTLSGSEIYDLVRVDYFSDKLEAVKAELATRSRVLLQEKAKNYRQIIGPGIDSSEKKLAEAFSVVYPVERYQSYQAYTNSELNAKPYSKVNQVEKSTTLYYQPVVNKEFDFVINPIVMEPVIQVMYVLKMEVNREKPLKVPSKEYYIITPNGDLKKFEPKN
jgi:hypothetical protein